MKGATVFLSGEKRSRPCFTRDGFLIHQGHPGYITTQSPGLSAYRLAIGIVCACEQRTLDNGKN